MAGKTVTERATVITRITVRGDIDEFEQRYERYLSFLEGQPGMLVAQLAISVQEKGVYYELTRWDTVGAYRTSAATPEFAEFFSAVADRSDTDVTMTAMQVSTGAFTHNASKDVAGAAPAR
ncbi:antibiotic biosynthesis monooxygenase family protein [Kutzneria sp. NPDC051319]|uniref:antibiotic biosynthesis monooxygenase family protein n=1 Tax=Kutzneria sp. NPDC051319 TaxID=3155047 RepID=UPI00343A14FC